MDHTFKRATQSYPPLTKVVAVSTCLCLSVCDIDLDAGLWDKLFNRDLAGHVLDSGAVCERRLAAHEGLEIGRGHNVVQVQILQHTHNTG